MAWLCEFNVKGASTLSCSSVVFVSVSSAENAFSVCLFALSRSEVGTIAAKGVIVCKSTSCRKSNANVRPKLLAACDSLFVGGGEAATPTIDIDTHDSNCSGNASRCLASSHLRIIYTVSIASTSDRNDDGITYTEQQWQQQREDVAGVGLRSSSHRSLLWTGISAGSSLDNIR